MSWPTSPAPAPSAWPPSGGAAAPGPARSEHDRRYLRFNDALRTVTAQLPAESYAEAKACLEALAKAIPSDEDERDAARLGPAPL